MNELIKIENKTIGNEKIETVDARELHKFLENKRDFSNWIIQRIEKYDFKKDQEFTTILLKTTNSGRPRKEYYVSIDMAKELSMVENNKRGKEARRYFIKCERKSKENFMKYDDPVIAALDLSIKIRQEQIKQAKEIEHIKNQIDNQIDFYTVLGYSKMRNLSLPLNEMNKFGRKVSKESKKQGYMIGKVPDSRFGTVNSYHVDMLDFIFEKDYIKV